MEDLRQKRERTHAQRLKCLRDFVGADSYVDFQFENRTQGKICKKKTGIDDDVLNLIEMFSRLNLNGQKMLHIEQENRPKGSSSTSPLEIKEPVPVEKRCTISKRSINDRLLSIRLNANNRNELAPLNMPVMKDELKPTNARSAEDVIRSKSTNPLLKLGRATQTLLKNDDETEKIFDLPIVQYSKMNNENLNIINIPNIATEVHSDTKNIKLEETVPIKHSINDRLFSLRQNANNRSELFLLNLPAMRGATNAKCKDNIINWLSMNPIAKLVVPTQTMVKNPVQLRFLSTKSDTISNSNQSITHKTEPSVIQETKIDNENLATSKNIPNKLNSTAEVHSDSKTSNFEALLKVQWKFPMPKNVLHNFYDNLATALNDKSLKVRPLYKLIQLQGQQLWACMYNLKWPLTTCITAESYTKKKASYMAASKALEFLFEQGKISSSGSPLVCTKEDTKKLTQQKQTVIQLDSSTIKNLQNVIQIYSNKMKPIVESVDYKMYLTDHSNNIFGDEQEAVSKKIPQFLGVSTYRTKEKVVLPISSYKDTFIDLLQNSNCVIVKGEPGCGKSSRVPQYVLESWIKEDCVSERLCRIAVTQPRRIAAISLADRVAYERNEEVGSIVGYQVRLKSNFQLKTGRILYCTTGILLRYLQSDPSLSRFSHVILDEAHERDVNTDLLMNLLKRALKHNDNLKVIVMSATIDAEAFSDYFGGAPVLNVPGFTYPVKRHFLEQIEVDCSKTMKMSKSDNPSVVHQDVVQVIRFIHKNKSEGAILVFLPGWEDLSKIQQLIPIQSDLVVHLVHSKLKDSEQYKIFSKPPPGVRKIILATNVAETSITIDDVVYVIDTGIHKENVFDIDKGINVIDMEWISKASANQRAGRAGRCSPGESFHLYSQTRYEQMPEYSAPKILNSSLTKVVLDSKVYANNMIAEEFMDGLITPPERAAVKRAVDELKQLELLDETEFLTPLGRTLANFQLEPNLAKALVNGVIFKCATPIVDIVTLFSSESEIFGSSVLKDKDSIKAVKQQFCKTSDHLALMRVFEEWLKLEEEEGRHVAERFCRDTNLVPHKLEFVNKLKDIHFGYLNEGLFKSLDISDQFSDNDELVKAVLYAATGTVLKHRNWDVVKNRLKSNVNVLVTRNNHKATITSESVNYKRRNFPSDFLVYINETHSNIRRTTIVRECSLIPALTVLLFNNRELELVIADSAESPSDDMVTLGIKNTKIRFLCDKEQANVLMSCKKAIDSSYRYLVYQLTYGDENIPEFSNYWDEVLENLSAILYRYKIE